MIISTLLHSLSALILSLISALGYTGVFILMIMESMIFPVPSELVLPFAGFLAAEGTFNIWLAILAASIGSLVGSLLSYAIGKYGGKAFVSRYGKYFLLDEHDLERTHNWFTKRGDRTIFIARFIPIVRHLISIPAGIGNMNLKRFCVYTFIGATMWNAFLIYLGYILGQNWDKVKNYTEPISILVIILLIILGVIMIYRHIKHKKQIRQP